MTPRKNLDRFSDGSYAEMDPPEHECEGCGHFIRAPGLCYTCHMAVFGYDERKEKDDGTE